MTVSRVQFKGNLKVMSIFEWGKMNEHLLSRSVDGRGMKGAISVGQRCLGDGEWSTNLILTDP